MADLITGLTDDDIATHWRRARASQAADDDATDPGDQADDPVDDPADADDAADTGPADSDADQADS